MRAQITRRSLLAKSLLAGVGATGLALVGCGEDQSEPERRPTAPAAADQPQPARRDESTPAPSPAPTPSPQPADNQQSPASVLSELPVAMVVDPLEWRERFHWRKLRDAPGRPRRPQRGGELRFPASGPWEGDWNPLRPPDQVLSTSLLPLFYSQLVELVADDSVNAHDNVLTGDLAADLWEIISTEDIIFHLADGVTWPATGPLESRELTVEDVVATHETYRNANLIQRSTYRYVDRIEPVPDSLSVAFHLDAPDAAMLMRMSSPWHVVLREEIVSDRSMWDLAATPAGTGPFTLDSSTDFGRWRAVRNPIYFKRDQFGEPLPYLDAFEGRAGITVLQVGETSAEVPGAWVHDGGVDQIHVSRPSLWRAALDARPDSITQVSPPTPGEGLALYFKLLTEPPFNDPRVRIAISRSIDRKLLAERLYDGLAAPDCGHNWTFVADPTSEWDFREWPWSLDELGEAFIPDAQAARGLLSAAGYSAAQPLSVRLDAPPDSSEERLLGDREHELVAEVVGQGLRDSLGDAVSVELARRTVTREQQGAATVHRIDLNQDANIWFQRPWYGYRVDPDDLIRARIGRLASLSGHADYDLAALAEAQRRELDWIERSAPLEQLRQLEAEQVWQLDLINPYGISLRREYVFDKVDTHFSKNLDQRPRQLERVWRGDADSEHREYE